MAASKKTAPRKTQAPVLAPTPRHLWLASLGMLLAAGRESKAVVKRATAKVENTVADARYAVRRVEADLRDGIDGVRHQVEPKVVKFSSDVEARLAPVLDKLGLKAGRAPRKARKPAPKATRRVARKPAARMAKKAAR